MEKKSITISYNQINTENLNSTHKKLLEKAIQAAINAYAPYSEFRVGAAVLLDNNEIIPANNQENIAYPSGLCAERLAVFYANSKYPNSKIISILITAVNKKNEIYESIVSPCGACRQVIIEAEKRFNSDISIILTAQKNTLIFNSAKDLLPVSFSVCSSKLDSK